MSTNVEGQGFLFVYYPGHLGIDPITHLPGDKGIKWDRSLKVVPDVPSALELIHHNGFKAAILVGEAAKKYGCKVSDLHALHEKKQAKIETIDDPVLGNFVFLRKKGVTPLHAIHVSLVAAFLEVENAEEKVFTRVRKLSFFVVEYGKTRITEMIAELQPAEETSDETAGS